MKVFAENDCRKIDSLGRVTIPKGMRNRWGLHEGDEMWFFTVVDKDGIEYIALTNKAGIDPRYETAA
jgi:AbrB family looped-hinge helix DNA binding protein